MEIPDTLLDSLADRIAARLAERQPQQDDGDPLLTATQAARRLKVSNKKLYKLVAAGVIKRAKGFTEIRIRRSVLDAYGT